MNPSNKEIYPFCNKYEAERATYEDKTCVQDRP
jgi:hypothetical protein